MGQAYSDESRGEFMTMSLATGELMENSWSCYG
jgi:hypothetical protein